MTHTSIILPGTKAPNLNIKTTDDKSWSLGQQNPENFTILIFYRGVHCPVCKKTLEDLNNKLSKFEDKGTSVLALSMDSEERAKKSKDEWDIENVELGYGLSAEDAISWGLYLSESISDKEPRLFSEPGLFILKPDQTLYAASIQTMPFARPALDDVLGAIDFILEKDYPARGTVEPNLKSRAA